MVGKLGAVWVLAVSREGLGAWGGLSGFKWFDQV